MEPVPCDPIPGGEIGPNCSTNSSQEQNSFPELWTGLEKDSWALMSSCVVRGRSVSPGYREFQSASSRAEWSAHVAGRALLAWICVQTRPGLGCQTSVCVHQQSGSLGLESYAASGSLPASGWGSTEKADLLQSSDAMAGTPQGGGQPPPQAQVLSAGFQTFIHAWVCVHACT